MKLGRLYKIVNTKKPGKGNFGKSAVVDGSALKVLGMILQRRDDWLPPPSVREMMAACGAASTNATTFLLHRLDALGLITWHKRQARTLTSDYYYIPAERLNDA